MVTGPDLVKRASVWFRGPHAAGNTADLDHCNGTAEGGGFTCGWARARMSPHSMVTLGRDLQSIVGHGDEPQVTICWGKSLSRTYPLEEIRQVPLESLRKAHQITIGAGNLNGAAEAEVTLRTNEPPALAATVRCPDDREKAQKVKDAVELGDWNPVNGRRLALVVGLFGFYSFAVLLWLLWPWIVEHLLFAIPGVLCVTWLVVEIPSIVRRLWPPVEIYSVERAIVAALKGLVPVVVGVSGLIITLLKFAGLGE